MKTKSLLFAAFTVLWVLDTLFTLRFVGYYGLDMEANPIIRWVLSHGGAWGFITIKAAVWTLWAFLYDRAHVLWGWFVVLVTAPAVYMGYQVVQGIGHV